MMDYVGVTLRKAGERGYGRVGKEGYTSRRHRKVERL